MTVNLYEAKTQLSQLVERAAGGEEVIIAKAGKPMVRMVPVEETCSSLGGPGKTTRGSRMLATTLTRLSPTRY